MYNFGAKFFIFTFAFSLMFSPMVGYSTLALNTIDSYVSQNDEVYLIYEDDFEDITDNVLTLPETGSKTPKCLVVKYTYVKGKKVAKIVKVDCPKKKVKVTPSKPTVKKNTPTPKPTKKLIAKKIAYKKGTSSVTSCPFVGTDYSTAKSACSQGPYGKTSHSCNKNAKGYYALDLTGSGYGIAPEHGTIYFYPESEKISGNCTKCDGHCLNTVRLKADSGRIYVYTHMILYGGVLHGQTVDKGQVIGQTYSPTTLEKDSFCSTGTHLDFSVIVDGARVSNIKSIYESLCNVTINCTEDNKCK